MKGGARPHIPYLNEFPTLDKFLNFLASEIGSGRVFKEAEAQRVRSEILRASDLVRKGMDAPKDELFRTFVSNGELNYVAGGQWSKLLYCRAGHVVYGVSPDGVKTRLYAYTLDVLLSHTKRGILREIIDG